MVDARPEFERHLETSEHGWHTTATVLPLVAAWCICAAVGFAPSIAQWLSLMLLGLICCLWKSDDFYIFLAVFVFFMDQFYITASMPLFRLYTYMVAVRLVLDLPLTRFRMFFLPALLVFCLFSVFGVGALNIRVGFNMMVDVLVGYCVLTRILVNPSLARRFFSFLALLGVAAGIYSLASGNAVAFDVGRRDIRSEQIVRYMGTFGDANYAGFFYLICIQAAMNIATPRAPALRVLLLLALHFFLLLTNSMTALIVYVFCFSFFISLRFRKRALLIHLIVLAVLFTLIMTVLSIPALSEIGFIKNVVIRVREQIRYLNYGRFDMFTSDRTFIWNYFLDFFQDQSLLSKLFGGNVVTTMIVDGRFSKFGACHQVYLQGLLTIGILGAAIVFLSIVLRFVYRFIRYFIHWRDDKCADLTRFTLICVLAWLCFGFSIDFLLDWRFMLFYFL